MSYIGKQPGFGIRNRYLYTATASQTTFSGADDNGQTLAYADSKYLDVYLNGVLLVAGTDYTATTLTSVTLTSGAAASDIVEIVAYDIFSVADTVSASNGGTFNGNITIDGDLTASSIAYPTSDGTSGQVITTDGSGTLSFTTLASDKIEEGNSSVEVVDAGTGHVAVTVDGSETARFEDNGRLGIGTTTPASMLTIEKTDTADLLLESTLSTNTQLKLSAIAFGTPEINVASNHGLIFKTNDTDRGRFDSGGAFMVGTNQRPSSGSNPGTFIEQTVITIGSSSSAAQDRMRFENPNGRVGKIECSGSSTSYITSSDYRLKENVVDLTGAITRLNQIPVHQFNFIADPNKTVDGFLAHEVQDIVPEAVSGAKDAVDDEGNPDYQGIDQSKLVPLLTAALQEAIGRIETLEAEVAALKGETP